MRRWWSWAEQWAQEAVRGQRAGQAEDSTEMRPPGCPVQTRWTHWRRPRRRWADRKDLEGGDGRACYCESGHFEGEPTSSLRNQLCHDITVHSLKVPQLHGITVQVYFLKMLHLCGIAVHAHYLKRHIYTALGVHIT